MVALFKRSGNVSTYKHHLAPISGSIEDSDASALAAAWRELREETTLTPASLELIREGPSYDFVDRSIGRRWTITPFAFRLKTPPTLSDGSSLIHIDWEHESWAWYDPAEVEDDPAAAFGGVPHLAKSLRRAWFEKDMGCGPDTAGGQLSRGCQGLRCDFHSGARELATIGLSILRDVVQVLDFGRSASETATASLDRWWTLVRLAAFHLFKSRESMGTAMANVFVEALQDIEDKVEKLKRQPRQPDDRDLLGLRNATMQDMQRRILHRSSLSSVQSVTENFLQYIRDNVIPPPSISNSVSTAAGSRLGILTLSNSATIAHVLCHLLTHFFSPRKTITAIDLHILESRPLMEGVSLAAEIIRYVNERLKQQQQQSTGTIPLIRVEIFTDACSALAARGMDFVLLGADKIDSHGRVCNKTGSLPTILGARHASRQAKVVVVAETEKIGVREREEEEEEDNDTRNGYENENDTWHKVEENDAAQVTDAWQEGGSTNEQLRTATEVVLQTVAKKAKKARTTDDMTAEIRRTPGTTEEMGETATAVGAGEEAGEEAGEVQVRINNECFEWVPSSLVDAYITEQGIWKKEDIRRYSETLEKKRLHFFG